MIGGYTHLTDFIQIPIWEIDTSGNVHAKSGKIYQRIIPTEPEKLPKYTIKRRLTVESEDMYYHPAIPFDLEKSTCPCKTWLSWEFVHIPNEGCTNPKGEMVLLIRIKPGTDIQDIDLATTKLCLIIKCNFESDSDKNWDNWLIIEKKTDASVEIMAIKYDESPANNIRKRKFPSLSDPKKKVINRNKILTERKDKNHEDSDDPDVSTALPLSCEDVARRIADFQRMDVKRKSLQSSSSGIEKRSTHAASALHTKYPLLTKIKKEQVHNCDNNSSSDDEGRKMNWSGSQKYVEEKQRLDNRHLM